MRAGTACSLSSGMPGLHVLDDLLNNIWALSSWDAWAGTARPEHACPRHVPERMPSSGQRGSGAGHVLSLDSLEETIWPWQENPWDFSIPPRVLKHPGVIFPCTRLLAGSGLGGCGVQSPIHSPAACLRANPALALLAVNSFYLPKRLAIRSVRQHRSPSPHLPPAIAAPLPVLPASPRRDSPRREQAAGGFLCWKLVPAPCPLPAGVQPGFQPAPTGRG